LSGEDEWFGLYQYPFFLLLPPRKITREDFHHNQGY
jgi:hypothetical protein